VKNGRPKGPIDKPARRSRAQSQKPDVFASVLESGEQPPGLAKPKRRNVQKPKRSLLGAILNDPALTKADKTAILDASESGLTLSDLSALVIYELKCAQRFFADGTLAAKDYVVATNKIATQIAAAAQMAATASTANIPSRIDISFDVNDSAIPTSDRVDRPLPGPTGDRVDVEG
jgi:hypothetical protein